MTKTTQRSTHEYTLAELSGNGSWSHLTELPTFRSGLAARDYATSIQHTARLYVLERYDVIRCGVAYGIEYSVVGSVEAR